ncbi:MAG: nitrilase-related carbon-nitrogen hydrolase, partial [Magnetovibrionaceae bacterium]
DAAGRRSYNSMMALDSLGRLLQSYDKSHLVPFGEYVPFADILPLGPIAIGGGFMPGPGLRTLTLPGLPPVGPLICYEVIFPGRVTAEPRPDWLLNL